MTRHPSRLLCALALVGALTLVASLASGATARETGAPGTWTVVGSGIRTLSGQIGTARTPDGVLHVVWSRGGAGTPWELLDTTVSPVGKVSTPHSIVSGWSRIDDVSATVMQGRPLVAVFSGTKTDTTGDPTNGLNLATSDGSGWTVGGAAIYTKDFASSSVPSVGYARDGNLVQAWSANGQVVAHVGVDPGVAAQTIAPGQNVSVAGWSQPTNATTSLGMVTVAWCRSDAQPGLYYDDFGSDSGEARVTHLAGSETTRCPAAARTAIARDANPGVINTTIVGSTGGERTLRFWWNLQPPVTLLGGPTIKQQVATAGDPIGKVWIGWRDATTNRLRFRRSNGSYGFGAIVSVPIPASQDSVYTLDLSAQDDRLDIVARATKGSAVTLFHTQTFPGLTVKATAKDGRVTVTVTDAGIPVPGSTVRIGGRVLYTDAKGQAGAKLPKGTYKVVASKPKYVGATTSVRVAGLR